MGNKASDIPKLFSIEPEPFKSLYFFLRDLTIYFLEIENYWKLRKYNVKLNGIGNQIGLYKEFGPFVHFFNLQQETSLVELHWNTITEKVSLLKVSSFQNDSLMSSFRPKNQQFFFEDVYSSLWKEVGSKK